MIKLNQLSRRERNTLLAGVTVSLMILSYFFIVEPILESYAAIRLDIAKTASLIARYKGAVVGSSRIGLDKSRSEQELKRLGDAVFINDTDALTAAQLTEMVRAKASSVGLSLGSSKPERIEIQPGFHQVSLSVSFNATLASLVRFMQELQNDQKRILIREAKISSLKEDYSDDQPEVLSVRLLLTALRFVPGSETKKEK